MTGAPALASFGSVRRGGPLAFVAGAASVAGFAPAGLSWLLPLSLGSLFFLWLQSPTPRRAALFGFLFGLGFFGVGVSWVYVSLHVFGMMPAPLAVAATLFFCVYLALFPALAGTLQARLDRLFATRALLAIPALWTFAEWLRGWLLTGFPWLAVGYSQADTPLAWYAPVGGVYGVSFMLSLAAAALAVVIASPNGRQRAAALIVAVAVYGAGWLLERAEWTAERGPALSVGLVQGNIAQETKFDPARYAATLSTYRRLIESTPARLVVLPETALPRFLDLVDQEYLDGLIVKARSRGADILLGAPFRDVTGRYYNGIVNLGTTELQFYAKSHLVPLGEFVPPEFHWIVSFLKIPLSDFSPGGRPRPMTAAGERIALTVCYEDAFGEELVAQLPEAGLLANVSNVAWFGDSLAPEQHLQIARMRSIETGRYMVRATNTGVTAVIDHRGRVVSKLPQFIEAVLEGSAQPRSGATPYVRWANAPILLVCLISLGVALAMALWPRTDRPHHHA